MKYYKYSVVLTQGKVTNLVTNDPNPRVKRNDTVSIEGDINLGANHINLLKNGNPVDRVVQLEVNIVASSPGTQIISFVCLDAGLDRISHTSNHKPVYAIVNSDGEILDRRGFPNQSAPRLFSRRSDATQSLMLKNWPGATVKQLFLS